MKGLTKNLFLAFCTFFIIASSAHAGLYGQSVGSNDLIDQRTFNSNNYNPPLSEGGLSGTWSNLSIAWNISYNSTALLWNYEYTLQGNKDISHFILEVTDPSSLSDFLNPQVKIGAGDWTPVFFEGPAVWGDKQGNSNPGLPADLYGIKFSGGATSVSYSFQTSQDPVWGNFYVKSGRAKVNDTKVWLYSYNNALGSDSGNELDFIPRPDGGNLPVVPEPISSILFVSGGAALAGIHLQKKKKKT